MTPDDPFIDHAELKLANERIERLKEEQRDLFKIIWTLVKKAGGEVRLSDFDEPPRNWELLEREDISMKILTASVAHVTNRYDT